MFKIYGLRSPMFIKTVLTAEEIGAPYEVIEVDLAKGEQKTPEHLKRHPFGKVPALEHDGKILFESNAIMRYMANVTKSPLYPQDPYERAVVDQWMDYFSLQAGRWCASIWFNTCVAKQVFNMEPDHKAVSDFTEMLMTAMPTLNTHLAQNKWLAGKNATIADANAYMLMIGFKDAGLNFADYPNFMRWFDEYAARPAAKKVQKWR